MTPYEQRVLQLLEQQTYLLQQLVDLLKSPPAMSVFVETTGDFFTKSQERET